MVLLAPRGMADTQDHDPVALDPVAQNIGSDRRHFASAFAGVAAPLGKIREAVGDFDQAFAEACGGGGVEGGDVGDDRFEMTDRFVGPDDFA